MLGHKNITMSVSNVKVAVWTNQNDITNTDSYRCLKTSCESKSTLILDRNEGKT